ncbi:MAG: hypothetical protein AB7F23_09600 [Phycisphaerae bacterium]
MRHAKYLLALLLLASVLTAAEKQYPYVARVTGENVFVRSGSGMNYYRCARISSPDTVKVTAEQFGWARIEPLQTCYSLIAKEYVEQDKTDKSVGVVRASNVNVWAGSPYVSPVHSTTKQLSLNNGVKVNIIGVDGDYFKIRPPAGASYWINSAYIEYLGALDDFVPQPAGKADKANGTATADKSKEQVAMPVLPAEETEPAGEAESAGPVEAEATSQEAEPAKEVVLPEHVLKQQKAYEAYFVLTQQLVAEREKPLDVQDFTAIKTAFEAIAADETNGRAALFAQAQLDEIARYESARMASEMVARQDAELARKLSEIRKEYKQKTDRITVTEGYIYSGTLAVSYIYTEQSGNFRYAVKDDAGSIIAYAVPLSDAVKKRAASLIGKKVGFIGETVADKETSKVIVYFSGIDELWIKAPEESATE